MICCSAILGFEPHPLTYGMALTSLEGSSQYASLIDDTLQGMEKYGIAQDLNNWLEILLLRSSLTHEYLTDNVAMAKKH